MPGLFGDPSVPIAVAADNGRRQPNAGPLGQYTGAPPATRLSTMRVSAAGNAAICIVPATRENRFIVLTAPFTAFSIYIGQHQDVDATNGVALPNGIPYEISLPGDEALYAASNAPVSLRLAIQVAGALMGDLERNLARR
jgi:hypothetical protein